MVQHDSLDIFAEGNTEDRGPRWWLRPLSKWVSRIGEVESPEAWIGQAVR